MIGYHYTSAYNWKIIQQEGLKPYLVESLAKVSSAFGVPNTGVWVYAKRQRGLSHLGCIMWQAITKKTEEVALLRVKYLKSWTLSNANDSKIKLSHDLDWKGFMFHRDTSVQVILHEISPADIQLVNLYDISTFADLYDQGENNAARRHRKT